jgi:hypothetical protein
MPDLVDPAFTSRKSPIALDGALDASAARAVQWACQRIALHWNKAFSMGSSRLP